MGLERDIDDLYEKIVEKTLAMMKAELEEFDAATSKCWVAIHLSAIRCRDLLVKSQSKTKAAMKARAVQAAKREVANATKSKRDSILAAYEIYKAKSKAAQEEAEAGAKAKFNITQQQVFLKKLYKVGNADGGLSWMSEDGFQLNRSVAISDF